MKNLTAQEKQTLENLFFSIRNNYATAQDYNSYEALLLKAGFDQNEIRQNLYSYNYRDWENYYYAKQEAKSYDQKRVFEVVIKGALLGLGLAALIQIAKDK